MSSVSHARHPDRKGKSAAINKELDVVGERSRWLCISMAAQTLAGLPRVHIDNNGSYR
jgi:hypothetical protein